MDLSIAGMLIILLVIIGALKATLTQGVSLWISR